MRLARPSRRPIMFFPTPSGAHDGLAEVFALQEADEGFRRTLLNRSDLAHCAIDAQHGARDEVAIVRREEQRGRLLA